MSPEASGADLLDGLYVGQLEGLIEVARLGSVSRAAEFLSIGQPALTSRLQALQRSLGVRLLLRRLGGMELTPAGREFLPHAESAVATLKRGIAVATAVEGSGTVPIGIAVVPAFAVHVLPDVLAEFERRMPESRLRVMTAHTEQIVELVVGGLVRLGLCRRLDERRVRTIGTFNHEYILVKARERGEADKVRMKAADVRNRRLMLVDTPASYGQVLVRKLGSNSPFAAPDLELDSVDAVKAMVAKGLGVALLPRMAIGDELRSRRFTEVMLAGWPRINRQLALIERGDAATTRDVVELIEVLTEITNRHVRA